MAGQLERKKLIMKKEKNKTRCPWPGEDALMQRYHDEEWGVPVFDDGKLFEFLVLESAQAGLSWRTVLHKRENYRRAFAAFDPIKVARFNARDRRRLLADAGIIRNRAKIEAAINNAACFLKVQEEFGAFSKYIWDFVDGRPIVNRFRSLKDLPAVTPLAERIARDLKERGFKFLGPTVLYAHMQATGMVNDHMVDCFRYKDIGRQR
jgi:DNA-3-methyladenine glycosylase I